MATSRYPSHQQPIQRASPGAMSDDSATVINTTHIAYSQTWAWPTHWCRSPATGHRGTCPPPRIPTVQFFSVNFRAAQSLTATLCGFCPNKFVFCDCSCGSSVAATWTLCVLFFFIYYVYFAYDLILSKLCRCKCSFN